MSEATTEANGKRLETRFNNKSGEYNDKVSMMGWKVVDEPGEFAWINKEMLNVDHTYQRDIVSVKRALIISRSWSWKACGALCVAKRPDGSYWVFDGQTRLSAAARRSDVQKLPCVVFQVVQKEEEAVGFLGVNTVRGPVRPTEKFRSRLVANDPVALEVQDELSKRGRAVTRSAGPTSINCIDSILSEYVADKQLALAALDICCQVYKDGVIQGEIYGGFCVLGKFLRARGLGELWEEPWYFRAAELDGDEVIRMTKKAKFAQGKGGSKVVANALVVMLNKGRRNRIPSMYETETD